MFDLNHVRCWPNWSMPETWADAPSGKDFHSQRVILRKLLVLRAMAELDILKT